MSVEHKAGVVEKATSWLRPSRHYQIFENEAHSLSKEELVAKRARYDHTDRNTVVISLLSLAATASGAYVLQPSLPEAMFLTFKVPIIPSVVIYFLGPLRGYWRNAQRGILDEEIETRGLKVLEGDQPQQSKT